MRRSLLRIVATLLLCAGLAAAAGTREVAACECGHYSVAKAKKMSKVVFVGTAVEELNRGWAAKFAVERLWKGDNVPVLTVYSERGLCSFPFIAGRTYLVYAYWDEDKGRLETDVCTRTRTVEDTEDLKQLGVPKVTRTRKAEKR